MCLQKHSKIRAYQYRDLVSGCGLAHMDQSDCRNHHSNTDAAQEAEACHMLHSIRELRERSSPHLTVEVYHTLAMLHYVLRDHTKVPNSIREE